MRKPDCVFVVYVSERWMLGSCAAKRDQERRGLFGFHLFQSCPDCVKEFAGWEFWGENGHKQGEAKDRAQLVHMLRYKATKQWKMQDGRVMGYRFRRGGKTFYGA